MTLPMPTLPGIPEQIARYQLLSELGRGSMGHVYLALDPNIDRKVAIKIFLPLLKVGAAEQWELRQRFVLEARAAGLLNHPGIVTIFDADTDADTGLSYLVMEWVNGPSLDDLIRESAPLSVDRSLTIVEAVALALDVAHRQGLVHRDIKPANILLESNGRAKVTDFGIAKLASMSITTTGWIPGSPFYMSPEQIRNENIDRRSDLYALGAVLYQCLTGALPFEAESLAALTHMILEIDPRPVRSINPRVSADLAEVIDRALAKSPDDRFDSGREFARALRLAKVGKFKPASSGIAPLVQERPEAADLGGEGIDAGDGSGTIGLPAATPDSREELPADEAPLEEEPDVPSAVLVDAHEVPAREAAATPVVGRRLALAVAILLGVVAVWSLRPVESEPSSDSSVVARFFSAVPRFAPDAPLVGEALDVPAQVPEVGESSGSSAGHDEPAKAAPVRPPLRSPALPPARPAERIASGERESSVGLVTEPIPAPLEPGAASVATASPAVTRTAPVARATSKLELVYRNRLKNASLAVSIDGEQVYAGSVAAAPGLYNRTVGKNMWTSLDLTPGEHVVDVRVTGSEGKVDLVRQVTANFEDGRTHRLRVSVTRLKNLKLEWKDSPGG